MKVSVIISFYNKVNFLKLVIAGFERQNFKEFELIISDDGSNSQSVSAVKGIIASSHLKIRHVWHADNGWRKNIILNKSIKASEGEYLIFVDGDCIPHKNFVSDHYNYREENIALTGRRVKFSEEVSNQLTPANVVNGWIEKKFFTSILKDTIFGDTKHFEKGLSLNNPLVKNNVRRENTNKQILGCNFSIFKSTLLALNGFDERYLGPCVGEDIDIDVRLLNMGGTVKLLRYCAIQYHIYHPLLSRKSVEENEKILALNQKENISYTQFGIDKN